MSDWLDSIDDDGPTYRRPMCGAVGKARTWAWFGWCREIVMEAA